MKHVCIAILVKQKEKTLPLYLKCISGLNYAKEDISLFIRTNNNTDGTKEILEEWISNNKDLYRNVYYDGENVETKVEQYGVHEWNKERFSVLGKIRQESMNYALKVQADFYFVMDVDNLVIRDTLLDLVNLNVPIVAPMLRNVDSNKSYSNFFAAVDKNGFYARDDIYDRILNRELIGVIQMPVVHCTYLINTKFIPMLTYDDGSQRYEFVIFSHSARKNKIAQYIDNRKIYGWLSLEESSDKLAAKFDVSSSFSLLYKDKVWGEGSGTGSSIDNTKEYRLFLSKFIKENNIKSVIDYGCGMWDFMTQVDLSEVQYLGYDVAACTIEHNQKYVKENIKFSCDESDIKHYDLLICKEVMQHLPVSINIELLAKFRLIAKYCLITNDRNREVANNNKDIEMGDWTTISLDTHPYSQKCERVLNYSMAGWGPVKTTYLLK